MNEKRKWGVVRDTTFNRGNRDKFAAMKVPRQCSFVLLVKEVEQKLRRWEVEKVER
jgi:hypothetical protein